MWQCIWQFRYLLSAYDGSLSDERTINCHMNFHMNCLHFTSEPLLSLQYIQYVSCSYINAFTMVVVIVVFVQLLLRELIYSKFITLYSFNSKQNNTLIVCFQHLSIVNSPSNHTSILLTHAIPFPKAWMPSIAHDVIKSNVRHLSNLSLVQVFH